MIAIWNNPEFIRNVRAQLRPGKVIATACICAAISIAVGFAAASQPRPAAGPYRWGFQLFQIAFWLQALIVVVGGGIACINNIYREKEQNTFDYQRVTRLTPLELTMGKLFGAPVFTYFVSLCLMPLAIFAVVKAELRISMVLAVYVALLVSTLAVHMLALLISLLTVRGSHTGAILLLLVLVWGASFSDNNSQFFRIGPLGPFYSTELLQQASSDGSAFTDVGGSYRNPRYMDIFFGHQVHHFPVFLAVNLLFSGWFLLALARNIKRDQNDYEIYSPLQALTFALFLNLLFVAFMQWRTATAVDCQSFLLTLNIGVFSCLGLAAIRNRQRMRRILHAVEGTWAALLAKLWPAPLIIGGALPAGLLIVFGVAMGRDPRLEWNVDFAVLRTMFFVAWITRDMQFLQWMGLRRGKHPLVMGVLFLVVFYVCVSILMASLGVYSRPERTPFSAFFVPSAIYVLDHSAWALRPAIWVAAFIAQWVLVAVFIALQRQSIEELDSSASAPVAATVAAQS